jgi:hypothetical protein
METEKDILIEINNTVSLFLSNIYKTIIRVNNIKQSVNTLDNNYFFEEKNNIYQHLLEIFEGNNTIQHLSKSLGNIKLSLLDNIENICDHEWVSDSIDISPDKSQQIIYCQNCEISKK